MTIQRVTRVVCDLSSCGHHLDMNTVVAAKDDVHLPDTWFTLCANPMQSMHFCSLACLRTWINTPETRAMLYQPYGNEHAECHNES